MGFAAPDRFRIRIGLALFSFALVVGAALLIFEFFLPPLYEPDPVRAYTFMLLGALLAFPAAMVYLLIPRLLDRYDPEPWQALLCALLWGGIVACGLSAFLNSAAASVAASLGIEQTGETFAAVLSAPVVEELWKGLGIIGFFYFLRRQFDGIVDGVIFATFIGLGFAAVENVIYYAKAAHRGDDALALTFVLRGVLSPWVHPLFTSMIGVGFGFARQSPTPLNRVLAPLVGYIAAVALHFVWNATATLIGGMFFLVLLPLWLLFVVGFLMLVASLVLKKGRVMRAHLEDEVRLGTISAEDLELVCSAFGMMRARIDYGMQGEEFVRATARLALHKWHADRAERHALESISPAFIQPLRNRIAELSHALGRTTRIPIVELEGDPFPDREREN
jgi:RsiW-degrading membrane proteinase PrsW (M82 family)